MCKPKNEPASVKSGKDSKKPCSGKCNECREKKQRENTLIKTLSILTLLLGIASTASAQQPVASFWTDPLNSPLLPLYALIALIVLIAVLVAVVGFYVIKVVNLLTTQIEKERARQLGIAYKPPVSWWSRFMNRMNKAVPVEQEQSIEMGHDYDGIRELDNHLPPWWKWLFIGTVIWSAIYMFVYHVSDNLPLQLEEYENELTRAEEAILKLQASQPQAVIDENSLEYVADAAILENGQTIYTINCVACHAKDGGGNAIGPNLADEYWLNGGSLKNIFSTIKNGVVEKGMPAWGKNMSPKDVRDVAFYVMSLQGTTPQTPKAPQGEYYKSEPVKKDSVAIQAALNK